MKDLSIYIKEGFYKNVGIDTEGIQDWMKKWSERDRVNIIRWDRRTDTVHGYTDQYHDYNITLDPDNLCCRIHYLKNKSDKNDIVIPFVDWWKDIKELDPNETRIIVMNRNTMSNGGIWMFEKINGKGNSVIRFKQHGEKEIEFHYDKQTKKITKQK